MSEAERQPRGKGRPSAYDPDLVRDISEQVLVEFYNNRPGTLRDRIDKDPDFVSKLRDKARYTDDVTRSYLIALDAVPDEHANYRQEIMFIQWCLRLEPTVTPAMTVKNHELDKTLRGIAIKNLTDDYWRTNCKRFIDAIERVRQDRCLKLKIPAVFLEDDGDDFL